jgi:hypothetical protein
MKAGTKEERKEKRRNGGREK